MMIVLPYEADLIRILAWLDGPRRDETGLPIC